jgi:hypothetical protein
VTVACNQPIEPDTARSYTVIEAGPFAQSASERGLLSNHSVSRGTSAVLHKLSKALSKTTITGEILNYYGNEYQLQSYAM